MEAWDAIAGATTSWHQAKLMVEHALDISHDTLHLFAGVLLWLAAALLLRRPISSWWPWLTLMVLTAINELVDLRTEKWPDAGMQVGEAAKDVALTLFVPSLLMLALRFRPGLFHQASRPRRAGRRRK